MNKNKEYTELSQKIETYINNLDENKRKELVEGEDERLLQHVVSHDSTRNNKYVTITKDKNAHKKTATYTMVITTFYNKIPTLHRAFLVTLCEDSTVSVKEYKTIDVVQRCNEPLGLLSAKMNDRQENIIDAAIDIEKALRKLDEKVQEHVKDNDITNFDMFDDQFFVQVVNTPGDLEIEDIWIVPIVCGKNEWTDCIDNMSPTPNPIKIKYNIFKEKLSIYDNLTDKYLIKKIKTSKVFKDLIIQHAEENHNRGMAN